MRFFNLFFVFLKRYFFFFSVFTLSLEIPLVTYSLTTSSSLEEWDLTYEFEGRDLYYDALSSGSLALDSHDHPRIVYGQDQILFASYDGSSWNLSRINPFMGATVGYFALAIDDSDHNHIVFFDQETGSIEYSTNSGGEWTTTIIEEGIIDYGDVIPSIAVDSSGQVHVSYQDTLNEILKYAIGSGGSWTIDIVDSSSSVGESSSLVVDSSGTVHIVYDDDTNDVVKYAVGSTGSWSTYTIASSAVNPSIALDSSNGIHVSYFDHDSNSVNYATGSDSSWTSVEVQTDDSSTIAPRPSIAIDTYDRPHISYANFEINRYIHAVLIHSRWMLERINDNTPSYAVYSGSPIPIAIDSVNQPHLVYITRLLAREADINLGLKYGIKESSSWQMSIIDQPSAYYPIEVFIDSSSNIHLFYQDDDRNIIYSVSSRGSWTTQATITSSTAGIGEIVNRPSVTMDTSGRYHIAYQDNVNGNFHLRYVVGSGSSWTDYTVDAGGGDSSFDYGFGPSIAVDSLGQIHISYFRTLFTGARFISYLKYAVGSGSSWTRYEVDSNPEVDDNSSSIGVDSTGQVHIAYFLSYPDYDLNYAVGSGSSWTISTLDSSGDLLLNADRSLAIDSSDQVHICYYDYSNGDVRYATDSGGSWNLETVDSNSDVGLRCTLVLDTSDHPHLAYLDRSGGVRYAYEDNLFGSLWWTSTIDSRENVGDQISLVLDSNDEPYLFYSEDFSMSIILASPSSDDGYSIPIPSYNGRQKLDH